MIFFWPNFDVGKEQISNAKREHGQTDAENPYKTATVAREQRNPKSKRAKRVQDFPENGGAQSITRDTL